MGSDSVDPNHHTQHAISVAASAEQAYACLRRVDLGESLPMRAILAVRGLHRLRSLDAAIEAGFIVVEDDPPRSIVLGIVAQPWRLKGNLQRVAPHDVKFFDKPGFVRVLWDFTFETTPNGCAVATSTSIYATSPDAAKKFGRYWRVVGPFSSMLRRSMLRSIRSCAEAS